MPVAYHVLVVVLEVLAAAASIHAGLIVEHRVARDDAHRVALTHIPESPSGRGKCGPCSDMEMSYCLNGDVMHDHCCCDRKYEEVFPFIEHTCYLEPDKCQVRAGNCQVYGDRRKCCCHGVLRTLSIQAANGSEHGTRAGCALIFILLCVLRAVI